jgi:hypothetical protein
MRGGSKKKLKSDSENRDVPFGAGAVTAGGSGPDFFPDIQVGDSLKLKPLSKGEVSRSRIIFRIKFLPWKVVQSRSGLESSWSALFF